MARAAIWVASGRLWPLPVRQPGAGQRGGAGALGWLLEYAILRGTITSENIRRLRFDIVPDSITSALEVQKGSADALSNALTPDMVYALRTHADLAPNAGLAPTSGT